MVKTPDFCIFFAFFGAQRPTSVAEIFPKKKFFFWRVSKKVKNGKNGKKGRKIWGVFDQKKSEGSWVQS